MNSEEFEEILRKKYDSGIHKFTGKNTHIVYELRNPTNKVRGWAGFANGKCLVNRTSFFAVAYAIYDREVTQTAKQGPALNAQK